MSGLGRKLTRIGVFYDGNFFRLVSNHYLHSHPRQARISLAGLHHFVRHRVALEEGQDPRLCQVVDAHYFRGRLRAQEAEERTLLLAERSFEDVLMREGITTHYLPMGPQGEKGIDVWLALEAFELALHKRFDVLVLIACDGDFVPLLRKLATLGTRTMLLGWNFTVSEPGREDRETRTSQALFDEATYPVPMHQLIDQHAGRGDALIDALFLRSEPRPERAAAADTPAVDAAPMDGAGLQRGVVQNLKDGYGFATPAAGGPNVFFAYSALLDVSPADLRIGDPVVYELSENNRGPCAVNVRHA
jgi:cold shock CspA family protein